MEIRNERFAYEDKQRFIMDFSGQDFINITKEALLDQIRNMLNYVRDSLAKEFMNIHREEIMKHISVMDIVAEVRTKCGDELVGQVLKR